VKTNEVLKLEDDASNLLGLPTCSTKKNWSVIRNMLLAAGAQPVHLCYHRDLPKVSDDKLQTVLQQLAVAANDAYVRLYFILKNRQLKFAGLTDPLMQEAARVIEYGKRAEERRLAEEEMARRAEKKREKRQPTSFHASASSSSLSPTFNSGLVLDKSSSIKKRAFREKIEQPVLDSTPFVPEIQQLSLTAAPTFAAMGNSASIAVTSSNSACGDGSAAKLMAGKSDSGSLLVAIIHLFKAGALNVAEKGTLKTLALAKERHILAALKTFQYDNDWHEFADTLKKLSQRTFVIPATAHSLLADLLSLYSRCLSCIILLYHTICSYFSRLVTSSNFFFFSLKPSRCGVTRRLPRKHPWLLGVFDHRSGFGGFAH
jgi:hypothetical protein